MKLRVDAARCVGHGRCYALAPDLFDEDDRGHARVEQPEVPPPLEMRARLAAENCPEGAIEVEEE